MTACALCPGYTGGNLGGHMRAAHGVTGSGPSRSVESIASAMVTADPVAVERIIEAARMGRPIGRPSPDDRIAALVTALGRGAPAPYRFGTNGQTIKHCQRLIADGTIPTELGATA